MRSAAPRSMPKHTAKANMFSTIAGLMPWRAREGIIIPNCKAASPSHLPQGRACSRRIKTLKRVLYLRWCRPVTIGVIQGCTSPSCKMKTCHYLRMSALPTAKTGSFISSIAAMTALKISSLPSPRANAKISAKSAKPRRTASR